MSSAEDVTVSIRGEVANFVAAIGAAKAALTSLEAKSGTVAKGLGAAQEGAGKLATRFNAGAAAAVALGKGAALAGVGIATGFLGGGMAAGLKRAEDIQDATVSLTKMLGSAKKAADLTGAALKIVKGTPFAFPDFAVAARELVAYGMAANKVPPILQAIADSAAASGQGAAAVQGLTYAFAQMQAQGRLNMGLVEQISGYGVSALGILANAYGKSVGDMQKFISAGNVSAAQGIAILQKGIEQGSHGVAGSFNALAGSAQNLGKTISGSLGNVKAAFARMGASWLKPFTDDLPNALNNGVIPLLDKLGEMGQHLAQAFESTDPLGKFTAALQKVPGILTTVVAGVGQFYDYAHTLVPTLGELKTIIEPIIRSFGTWSSAFGPLVGLWEQFRNVMTTTMSGALSTLIATIGTSLLPALVHFAGALTGLLPVIGQLANAYSAGLGVALDTFAKVLTALSPLINGFATVISGLPTPILAVGAALALFATKGLTIPAMLTGIQAGLEGMAGAMTAVAVKTEAMGAVGGAVSEASLAMGGIAEAVTPGGILLLGLGLLATAFTVLGTSAKDLKEEWKGVVSQINQYTGAVTDAARATAADTLAKDGALDAAKKVGISTKTLVDAAMGQKDAVGQVNTAMAEYLKRQEDAAMAGKTGRDAVIAKEAADAHAAGTLRTLRDAIEGSTGALADQRKAIQAADEANNEAGKHSKAFGDAVTAAMTGVTASKDALDKYTVAGQQNINTLSGLVSLGNEWVATAQEQGKSAEYISAAQIKVGQDIEATAEKMTGSKKAAVDYTLGLKGIPDFVKTQVLEDAIDKSKDIKTYAGEIGKLPRSVQLAVLEDAAKHGVNISSYGKLIAGLPSSQRLTLLEDAIHKGADIKTYHDLINRLPASQKVNLLEDAIAKGIDISKYTNLIKGIPKSWLSTLLADNKKAHDAFEAAKGWAAAWDRMHPAATISLNGAQNVMDQIAQIQYDASHIDASLAGRKQRANGGLDVYANGGMRDGMMARGGQNILWAEPETGWEAYISGRAGASARNKAVWLDAGRRLGMIGSGGGQQAGAQTVVNLNVTQQEAGSGWLDAALHKIRFNLG